MLERTILDTILGELLTRTNITDRQAFAKFLNAHAAKLKLSGTIPSSHLSERYRMLVREGKLPLDARVKRLLRRRAVRSLSGVSVVSLLTKPWSCPGKCVYCPTNPGLPKSYIPNEPAVQRAELNLFDPLRQVYNRLRALEMTGHDPEKCDVRII